METRQVNVGRETFHVYETGPIDHWDSWIPLSEYVTRLVGLKVAGEFAIPMQLFMKHVLAASYAVSDGSSAWEGDVRGEELYIATRDNAPPSCLNDIVLGWKQD